METIAEQALFYCVNCNQLKTMEQAKELFKTGFYRTRYRLGCCVHCRYLEEKKNSNS